MCIFDRVESYSLDYLQAGFLLFSLDIQRYKLFKIPTILPLGRVFGSKLVIFVIASLITPKNTGL
ncbi:MAG: hypothetical protein BWY72_02129 [Bacteroidetes bacterium ADurb.Bin416]|nr:MAG: hypothetical protein BWY72_02129 [Bacteroidetes bacterium ADurb.Bin416]